MSRRRPTHREVRRALTPPPSPMVAIARALRPFCDPRLAAGEAWEDIIRQLAEHLAGSQGAEPLRPRSAVIKPASGSDATQATMFIPRARPYVWHGRDNAPIKTN